MYHKDGYSGDGGGGDFSGNFTQNNFQPLAGSPAGQPSLLQQQQVGILHHEEPGEFKSMGNGFQAEISMLNQQAFAQNGFIPPVSQVSELGQKQPKLPFTREASHLLLPSNLSFDYKI